MLSQDIDVIKEELAEWNIKRKEAPTRGEELDAWAEWCKCFDRKEAAEQALRSAAEDYAL